MIKQEIGNAIWVYIWAVERVTRIVEKDGVIYGEVEEGEVIRYGDIAKALGMTERTIFTHMQVLRKNNLVHIERTSYGVVIYVKEDVKLTAHKQAQIEEEQQIRTEKSNEISYQEQKKSNNRMEKQTLEQQKNKVSFINYSFNKLINKNKPFNNKEIQCVKNLLAYGLTEMNIVVWTERKYREVIAKEPMKRIQTICYFENYLLNKYNKEQRLSKQSSHFSEDEDMLNVCKQWEANALDEQRLAALVQEVQNNVRRG
ncbi:MAG: hypothetical protein ACI35O_14480 [Bacillaceae bacterium]